MNILIVNLHSALNLGDEAIMRATLLGIKRVFPEARVTATANDPTSWAKISGLKVVGSLMTWVFRPGNSVWKPRILLVLLTPLLLCILALVFRTTGKRILVGNAEKRDLLQEYYTADLVLSCGGGNFFSYKPFGLPFLWGVLILEYAIWLRKPIVILPQSIGPLSGWFQKCVLRHTMNRVKHISTRDEISAQFLRQIGVVKTIITQPDIAFTLGKERNIRKAKAEGTELKVGITIMDRGAQFSKFKSQDAYEDAIVSVLTKMVRDHGVKLYIYAQCFGPAESQDDRVISRRLYSKLQAMNVPAVLALNLPDALTAIERYADMDFMIGARMHTGIFSLTAGTPVILIGYQPKALGMMRFFNLERFVVEIDQVSTNSLLQAVDEMIQNLDMVRTQVREKAAMIFQQAAEWEKHLKWN